MRDRRSRWNDREYEPAKARKWNCRVVVSCSRTENCNERCGSAWWPDCPRGTIGERWRVFWKATGSRRASRQFVAASGNQLRVPCERRLEDLHLVVLMIDGIHFGGQVLVAALGIAEGGEKHVLGVWQGATENTTVVKGLLEDLLDRGLNRQRQTCETMASRQGTDCVSPSPLVDRAMWHSVALQFALSAGSRAEYHIIDTAT